ncbi:MAG: phenylacetate--CoA ligase family protein, partial [Lachnospiraceae bacterium]|nr:phenylacetate--CoA ligase family protein [Candidatus Equihabitans merdae]
MKMKFDEKLRWWTYWTLDRLKGRPVGKYYDEIRRAWKKGSSVEGTNEKIQKLIAHAVATTEFYKDYSPETPLSQLPVMNKEIIRSNYDLFYSSMYKDAPDNRVMSTSGSTGTPFSVIQNLEKIRHNTAASIFLGTAAGYYIGMKEAFVRMWVGDHAKKSKLSLIAENLVMMDCANVGDEEMAERVALIRDKKVAALVGYSSALGDMSDYIKRHDIDTSKFNIQVIIPISENMPDAMRDQLYEQFHCPVRSWFCNEENGIMGVQVAEKGAYYIDSESYYYEILKMDSDEPAEEGELGRIVITDLYNYALPLIRYDNGDLAKYKKIEKNGQFKMMLTELYGRRSDIIYDTKGRYVSPFILYNNLAEAEGLRQYRFIQETEDTYTLWLNGNPDEIDADGIVAMIKPYLGEGATLTVDYVDEIPA